MTVKYGKHRKIITMAMDMCHPTSPNHKFATDDINTEPSSGT